MNNNILLRICVRAFQVKERIRAGVIRGAAFLLCACPVVAMADGDIADLLDHVATGAKSGTKSSLTIAQFLGVLAVIGGLLAAKGKKDNPQVKTWHIVASIALGAVLIVVPELIKRAQTQIGMTPVNVGS